MQRVPRLTVRGQLVNLWRTGPARANVTPSTSAAEVTGLSTRINGSNSHSSQFIAARAIMCNIRTLCGSVHSRVWKPEVASVSTGSGMCAGTRGFSAAAAEELTEDEFHRQAETTLNFLQERIEAFVEDADIDDSDVENSMGVMTVKLGSLGTFVLNKQAPNRQLWISSPISGPIRYDFDAESQCWIYKRDGHKLKELLEKELSELCGGALSLK
eukprot:CAMPEP_0118936600 /NCGR_PEP_ID=MMETSP1169-20130426/19617_1 /TAXON_ID=36882 /ORGANISM="Pyramimonas obovata, Strain CCMP722" /LENGTH=213 /DNA_ID=CAMNT_0006879909 /DNA_START=13 /DNA_END=654 /DNA_ORIENTATION=-